MIFDSHAHYDDPAFNEDQEEAIKKVQKAGVTRILNCSSSIESSTKTLEIVKKYDFIYGAIGVHPWSAQEVSANINKLGDMLNNDKIKSVGEIGLDYYPDDRNKELQIKAFKEQMDLARQFKLPVVIHDRDAHEDTIKIIKEFKDVIGVYHRFSGNLELAKEALKCGYYLSFTGEITYNDAQAQVQEKIAREIPIDRMLIETDCPYATPEPYTKERNDSSYLVYIIKRLAEIRKTEPEYIIKVTYENANRLFKISTTTEK